MASSIVTVSRYSANHQVIDKKTIASRPTDLLRNDGAAWLEILAA
jgi:hypothetical protein